ncbi:acetolactate decarboxylase [Pediococcus acidilactici]|uniref:acetolactate decarboxylase n=1 Tax=Pediococcus acidilactici TaxID=1254 RepID=UPI001330B6F7|nr:acetolactate decarboxylase [Pediococcus acidilactici]KAF0354878.1 acetolactate decarboxylase [Pediococcus acidilactici]KAF0359185.1 acetolactate decarboxylase [Pediococcus acidilactici]KAF0448555.1 acetolactate decarboxylase [Pediococcus acidilactici]
MAKLFQHGTLAMLVDGLFGGTLTAEALLEHGDFGIGTAEGLDGEVIILDGVAYQALADGSVRILEPEAMLPFADVNQADFEGHVVLPEIEMAEVDATLAKELSYQNTFVAIKISGLFSRVQTRVVKGQQRPYPTLSETATKQQIFDAQNIKGTVVGYYSPKLFHGASVAGMHLHFIDDQHQFGGHLLDFKADQVKLSWQILDGIDLSLPIKDSEFMKHQASDVRDIQQSIAESE